MSVGGVGRFVLTGDWVVISLHRILYASFSSTHGFGIAEHSNVVSVFTAFGPQSSRSDFTSQFTWDSLALKEIVTSVSNKC